MKGLLYALTLLLLASCYYKDIEAPTCYIQSETLGGVVHNYGYNDKNQLTMDSYPGDNAVMAYDAKGNIVSESDSPDIVIAYIYNDKSQLTQMDGSSATYPLAYNWQAKYSYNSNAQLTKVETWLYSGATSSLYLDHYEILEYTSAGNKNYSSRKHYDASSNLQWTFEFQWDNHPNPHLKNPYFSNEPPPTNNITAIKYTPVGGATYVNSYTYNYNSNGYPSRQWYNGNIVSTYTYTNCN